MQLGRIARAPYYRGMLGRTVVRTPYCSVIKGEPLEHPIVGIVEGELLRAPYYSDSKWIISSRAPYYTVIMGELLRHPTTENLLLYRSCDGINSHLCIIEQIILIGSPVT